MFFIVKELVTSLSNQHEEQRVKVASLLMQVKTSSAADIIYCELIHHCQIVSYTLVAISSMFDLINSLQELYNSLEET